MKGLTTAATLWVVAAIGMASGVGYYWAAFVTTALVLISLGPLRILAFKLSARTRPEEGRLAVELPAGTSAVSVLEAVESAGADVSSLEFEEEGDSRRVDVRVRLGTGKTAAELIDALTRAEASPRRPLEPVRAVLASANPGKLRELRRALPDWEIEPLDADDYPPETGETYYENARAKALFGREREPGSWVLGEDSGLEVAGLDGAPGIKSARFAGGLHVERVLAELEGVEGEDAALATSASWWRSPPRATSTAARASSRAESPRSHRAQTASASTRSSSRRARSGRSRNSATSGKPTTPTAREPRVHSPGPLP